MSLIAQISDLHIQAGGEWIDRRIDTLALLERAVGVLNRFEPKLAAVLVTGDLADRGSDADYQTLRQALAKLVAPVYLMPGNHDRRDALRRCFHDHRYLFQRDEDLAFDIEPALLGGVRLLCLDSLVSGADHGALSDQQLDWLEQALAQHRDAPTIVAVHHPPFATGIELLDTMGLRDGAARLCDILRRAPNLQRVLSGHVHRPVSTLIGSALAMTAPSSAHQIALELRPSRRGSYCMEPPAALLHRLGPNQDLITHTLYLGEFGAAHSFS